jgi:hypothetical protein
MEPDKLNSQHWQLIEQRMQTEEAACVLCQGDQGNENGELIDEEDEEDGVKDPVKAAKDMKQALQTGGVDKMANVGAQKAAQGLGMLGKGVGGMVSKGFSLW